MLSDTVVSDTDVSETTVSETIIGESIEVFWRWEYNYMLEIGEYDKLREVIYRDYNTYSGHVLEHYFRHKLAEEADITRLGNWWDRKGENEIDIITENELDNRLVFYEVKRQAENISIGELKKKAEAFFTKNKISTKYDIEYQGLTLEDM